MMLNNPVALVILVYVLLCLTICANNAHEEAMGSGSSSGSALHRQGGSMATLPLRRQETEHQQTLHTGDTSMAEAKVYTYDNIFEEARKEADCSPVHQQRNGVHGETNEASATVKLHKKGPAAEVSGEVRKANVCITVPYRLGTGDREVKKISVRRRVTVMNAQIEPVAELHFRIGVESSGMVSLALQRMDIGINQWDSRLSSNLVFIHKVTIHLCPKPWADRHPCVEPPVSAQKFERQRSSIIGFQFPFGKPQQAAVTFQISNIISTSLASFRWASPKTNGDSNSSVFTWELCTWNDGTLFKFTNWKLFGKPKLPSELDPSHMLQLHQGPGHDSFIGKATWENLLVNEKALEEKHLEWDLKVTLHVALLQRKFYGVYSISEVKVLSFNEVLTF